jgi:hypothetical protein
LLRILFTITHTVHHLILSFPAPRILQISIGSFRLVSTHTASLPSPLSTSSSNYDKLYYPTSRSTSLSNKSCLLNFFPGSVYWCQLLHQYQQKLFSPSYTNQSISLAQRISSDLTIEGTGSVTWMLLYGTGDEIILHIYNWLYNPLFLLNLLGPKHLCQQTDLSDDGFIHKKNFSILLANNIQHTTTALVIYQYISPLKAYRNPMLVMKHLLWIFLALYTILNHHH